MKFGKILFGLIGTVAMFTTRVLSKEVLIDLSNGVPNAPQVSVVGDVVKIKTLENPTTGYVWLIVNRPDANQQVVSDLHEEFVPNHSDEGMFGVGGTKYFTFTASKEGLETLELVNCQHWLLEKLVDKETGKVHIERAAENDIDIEVVHLPLKVVAEESSK